MSRPTPRDRLLARRITVGDPQPAFKEPVATSSAFMGRLSRQQMAALEARFLPRVTADPTQALQYLGQQQVLQVLRSDYSE